MRTTVRTSRGPRFSRCQRHARRGLTFLEVVLAAVILASVAAVVMSALNVIYGQSERQIARLNAMELANRLMIIFLDDEGEFNRQPKTIEFEGRRFNWDSQQTDIAVLPTIQGDSADAIKTAQRLRNVAINVWLAPEPGTQPEVGAPSARVVRLVDIIYMNPDSVSNLVSTDEGRGRLINLANRSQRSGTTPRANTNGRNQGPPTTPPPGGGKSGGGK